MPSTEFETVRTARKEHRCYYGRKCYIVPGQKYVDLVLPPWIMIPNDVDDEGRTTYEPSGEWFHIRYHQRCVEW